MNNAQTILCYCIADISQSLNKLHFFKLLCRICLHNKNIYGGKDMKVEWMLFRVYFFVHAKLPNVHRCLETEYRAARCSLWDLHSNKRK